MFEEGRIFAEQSASGQWSTAEQQQHINMQELTAALFGLKAFCSEMKNLHVKLELDNTTGIVFINHMGIIGGIDNLHMNYGIGAECTIFG